MSFLLTAIIYSGAAKDVKGIMLRDKLNTLKEYIPGKSISEIAAEYGFEEKEIIKLGSNENPLGASPRSLKAIKEFVSLEEKAALKDLSIYPDSLGQSLAVAIKETFPEIGSAEVVVGNGMDNILECLSRLLIEPGSQTLIHTPTFEYYEMVTRWMHAEPVFVQSNVDADFVLNQDEYLNKLSETVSVAFLCSPNNPTGNLLSWGFIESVIEKANSVGAYVFLDEAYAEYSGSSHIDKVAKYENLIVGRTFSKVYGIAGLRVGWGVLPERLVADYRKVQTPFNINKLSLTVAAEVLKDKQFIEDSIKTNSKGKDYLVENLNSLGYKAFDTSANFLSFLAGEQFNNDASKLCEFMLKNGVILRNASRFRGATKDLVRLTIGTKEQNMKIIELLSQKKLLTSG